jgi:hypothetical protein
MPIVSYIFLYIMWFCFVYVHFFIYVCAVVPHFNMIYPLLVLVSVSLALSI